MDLENLSVEELRELKIKLDKAIKKKNEGMHKKDLLLLNIFYETLDRKGTFKDFEDRGSYIASDMESSVLKLCDYTYGNYKVMAYDPPKQHKHHIERKSMIPVDNEKEYREMVDELVAVVLKHIERRSQ